MHASRQRGRYSPERDKRSNRKPNRKTVADRAEDEKDIRESMRTDGEVRPTRAAEPPLPQPQTPHERVVGERPPPRPSWHQLQQAMTPSRSYARKTEDDK